MVSTDLTNRLPQLLTRIGIRCATAMAVFAFVAIPASGEAQLTKQQQKCVGKLTKDGGKLSKTESKLQQKCLKDAANGKLPMGETSDQCIANDTKGKIAKTEAKTLADEIKQCTEGSGFMTVTGAQTNLSGKIQSLELVRDLLGSSLEMAVQTEKADIKCQQKVQKAVDKVLAAKLKSYTKCAKLAAREVTTVDLVPFENCLISVATDAKVTKTIQKLVDTRTKSCEALTLNTIFPGDCNLVDPVQFDACADRVAECRACTTIAGMNGLATDCDLFDNGLADLSCASSAPVCGDGNVDGGEECDPGAEPICCSETCTNNSDGLACDDGTFCNGADTCTMGACTSPGDPCAGGAECNVTCNEGSDDCFDPAATACTDDGNVCTDDECDGAGTCAHPNNTVGCDDGDACTTVDVCGGGTCNGSVPPNCDDSNVCTDDSCDSGAGCLNTNNTDPCDDGLFCNGVDTCGGGTCNSAGDPCAGGAECNVTCNEATDDCFDAEFTPCTDDGNPCTDDYCDVSGACIHVNNTAGCDDGDACTTGDTCGGGTCNGGAPPNCDDGNVCTDDSCDSGTGCINANNTVSCDDGLFCNGTDTCGGGTCNSTGDPCAGGAECNVTCNEGTDDCFDPALTACTSDGNVCTDDVCDGAGTCTNNNNGAACDDGDACTTGDTCSGGVCVGGAPPNCDDGNVCTTDTCDSGLGCQNTNNTLSCDDGLFCNGTDTCGGGTCNSTGDPCTGGTECNDACNEAADNCADLSGTSCTGDGNVCTDDICDGLGACTHPNNTDPCDDGSVCTTVDTCGGGTCNGAVPLDCSDGNVCTDDVCNAISGCSNPNNTAPCDDGLFCNGADTCGGGTCSVHAGDPCSGGAQCNNGCQEGPDTCFNTGGSACDLPDDACDVNPDTCDGAGTCVDSDPDVGPELCYSAGDEDCDGNADSADTDADSLCQANGIQTCTCSDACEVGRIIPGIGATSLDGLTALTGEGTVTTSISGTAGNTYGSNTGSSFTHAFTGVPANLSLWLGFTGNLGHNDDFGGSPNVSQHRFAASDNNALSGGDFISEGPAGAGATGGTLTEPSRVDGLPTTGGAVGCTTSTATSLEIQRTSGPGTNWTAWGSPFPVSAMSGALQTEQSSFLTNTRLMPITGNGSLVTRLRLQIGGAAMDPAFDGCRTPGGTWGYGANLTAAVYGSYRDANVCP